MSIPRDPTSLSPSFLIAAPQLQDPNFRRTVVLIVQHDDEATIGLVLNRPADLLVSKICRDLGIAWPGEATARASWGGPVHTNSGWVLCTSPVPEDRDQLIELAPDLHVTSSAEALRRIADAEAPPEELRFFLGYAGWAPGQLEQEMALGAWVVAPAERDVMFRMDLSTIWENTLRGLGVDPATLISTPGVH